MQLNGKSWPLAEPTPLWDILIAAGYDHAATIAVERNGMIVRRTEYDTTIIQPNDSLEVVRFVGGG